MESHSPDWLILSLIGYIKHYLFKTEHNLARVTASVQPPLMRFESIELLVKAKIIFSGTSLPPLAS